jgi:hypothetical protein
MLTPKGTNLNEYNKDMKDVLGLTFGTLIAHFIPGLFIFLSVIISSYDWNQIEPFIKGYWAIVILLGSLLSLACGLILDSIRYLFTWIPKLSKTYRNWCTYSISRSDEDDRRYYDWIAEHHFRFHQFYGNLSLGLLFSSILLDLGKASFENLWVLYLLSAICALSAVFTYYTTMNSLRDRFQDH